MEEEDKVKEIECEESRPQAVRILRKRGDEVVVMEEEDTTNEVKRLWSTLSIAMKQIEVSIASAVSSLALENMVFFNLGALQGIARTAILWQQLIKRMKPLNEENEKLKEAMKLMEKNVQRAQRKRDLAESNARDLEYQKGTLSE